MMMILGDGSLEKAGARGLGGWEGGEWSLGVNHQAWD